MHKMCTTKLFADPFLILVNSQKQPMHAQNSFENKIFWKTIVKNPFLWTRLWRAKGASINYPSLFGLQNMFRRIPFLIIYRLGNFDYSIQGGFWVILKNAFADLCKPIHVDIIIPVSSDPLKSWNCRKEGENY